MANNATNLGKNTFDFHGQYSIHKVNTATSGHIYHKGLTNILYQLTFECLSSFNTPTHSTVTVTMPAILVYA